MRQHSQYGAHSITPGARNVSATFLPKALADLNGYDESPGKRFGHFGITTSL